MRKILFVHQNFPGQFRNLVTELALNPAFQIIGLGEQKNIKRDRLPAKLRVIGYPAPRGANPSTHHYLREYEAGIRRGQEVVRAAMELRRSGFYPDLILAHPGWGESLFLKDVFPRSRLINYFEFFYHSEGADVGFDPEYPATLDDALRVRIKNSINLQSLAMADAGISPTNWQKSLFPGEYARKIQVIHDGIDTRLLKPDPAATVGLPSGQRLSRADQVITYVSRNLEPYRGFHVFMRSLPRIMRELPRAQIVIVGGNEVSYGRKPPAPFTSYREMLLGEVGEQLDLNRVHFLGKVPYATYLEILNVSSLHVYLTYPFVLSWSLLEAMSLGCVVLASDTAPVKEVIEDGRNGFLVDFFQPDNVADRAIDLVRNRSRHDHIARAAREKIVQCYDFRNIVLPACLDLLS